MAHYQFDGRYQNIKITEGCIITYNTFFNVEVPFDDSKSKDWWYFKDYLLQIMYVKVNPNVLLDMGWYPEFDPEGRFVIRVFRENYGGEQLFQFESRSKKEMVDKIYEVLKSVDEGKIR